MGNGTFAWSVEELTEELNETPGSMARSALARRTNRTD